MRVARQTKPGQSIVLIALVILVLVATTGLAVDGGNAYQNQRNLDHVAGAASLAAMSYVAQQQAGLRAFSDSDVKATIENTLRTNRVTNYLFTTITTPVSAGQVGVTATYRDKSGLPVGIVGSGGNPPSSTWYVKVELRTPVSTYFARVVGARELNVSASATAGLCPPTENIYPLAIETNKVPSPNTSFTAALSSTLTEFNWLRWEPTGTAAGDKTALQTSLLKPGNLVDGFTEATDTTGLPNGDHKGTLEIGDWVWAYPSPAPTSSDIGSTRLAALKGLTWLILPIFDKSAGSGSSLRYHINRLGLFKLENITWSGSTTKVSLKFLRESIGDVCQVLPPGAAPTTYSVTGHVDELPMKPQLIESAGPTDLQIVFDISQSMLEGWGCTGCLTSSPNRRVDRALPALRTFVNGMYQNNADGSKSNVRISLVTFGQRNADTTRWRAEKIVNFVDVDNKAPLIAALSPVESDQSRFPQRGNRTPTAAGVDIGIDNLNAQATQRTDSRGELRDVRKVMVLVTDGLANVPLDGGDNCAASFNPPSGCNNDADWQYDMYYGRYDRNNSPIGKTLNLLNNAKRYDNVEVFVISVALDGMPSNYHLDDMASGADHLFNARNADEMDDMVDRVKRIIYSECIVVPDVAAKRNATGAQVLLYDPHGTQVATTTANSSGNYSFSGILANSNYSVSMSHAVTSGGVTLNYDIMSTSNQSGTLSFQIDPPPTTKTLNIVTLNLNPKDHSKITCPRP